MILDAQDSRDPGRKDQMPVDGSTDGARHDEAAGNIWGSPPRDGMVRLRLDDLRDAWVATTRPLDGAGPIVRSDALACLRAAPQYEVVMLHPAYRRLQEALRSLLSYQAEPSARRAWLSRCRKTSGDLCDERGRPEWI